VRSRRGQLVAAVAELARRYRLPVGSDDALLALIDLLAGDEHAPSAVTDPRAAVDVHLADSLVALDVDDVRRAGRIADIGAGAVESNTRRAAFLERAVALTGARGAEVVNARVEQWAEGRGSCDLVLARALAPLPVVVEYAAPLLRVGGSLVAWRGRPDREVERAGERAARETGLEGSEVRRVHPYPGAEHRYLHLMSKVSETPARFPRRTGVALKRPLGAPGGTDGSA